MLKPSERETHMTTQEQPTMPAQQDIVVLGVRDLPLMRDFYSRFGWKPRPRDGMFANFQLAGASLVLFPLDTLEEVVGVSREGTGFNGTVCAMFLESATALESTLDTARQAGATMLGGPADRAWGVRTAYFADPEGNVWELACVPPAAGDE
jgi:catechol 2,3-dioxygenase-like lactoylglutathione lyase family enzyme